MSILPLDSIPVLTLAHLVAGQLSPAGVPEEQWNDLVELALDHGLGGMLLWSLRQAGWAQAAEPRWQPLVDASRRNGRHNLLIEKARRQAAAALDQAGIPTIWLKGIALAHTCYPEIHLRPMADLDVLVPPDRMTAAREALLALGFRRAEIDFFELGGFTDQARHHEGLLDRSGQVRLELHFRLLAPSLYYHMEEGDLDWFWGQTEELAPDGPSFQALKPEANLLHLCAHAILQNQGEPLDLLHLLDLHLLVTRSSLDWDRVVEQAAALRWTYAVEMALGLLPPLFGTWLPGGVLDTLRQRRPADEIPPVSLSNLPITRRWDEWRQAFGRMTLGQRMRLVWATLFPPSAFLRQQYHLLPGEPLLKYYVYHFLDGGREVARSIRRSPACPKQSTIHGEDNS